MIAIESAAITRALLTLERIMNLLCCVTRKKLSHPTPGGFRGLFDKKNSGVILRNYVTRRSITI